MTLKENLKFYAQLCKRSYRFPVAKFGSDWSEPIMIDGNDHPNVDKKRDAQLFITYNLKLGSLVVCFRGSESKQDWLDDFDTRTIRAPFQESTGMCSCSLRSNVARIHRGFWRQFESVSDRIEDEIKAFLDLSSNSGNKCSLIMTGHSLGASLATIAGAKYSFKYRNEQSISVDCFTYGSPRVGNKSFKRLFNQHIRHSYRIVNDNDPVALLPTPIRFAHVDQVYWIEDQQLHQRNRILQYSKFIWSGIKSIFNRTHDPIKDHSIDQYIRELS